MIARTWHGVVPENKGEEYFGYLKKTGLSDYEKTPGNRGVYVFRRTENGKTHFLLLSLWEDWESIRQFAGDEMEKARYYPEDEEYLLELEPFVTHYEVLAHPGKS